MLNCIFFHFIRCESVSNGYLRLILHHLNRKHCHTDKHFFRFTHVYNRSKIRTRRSHFFPQTISLALTLTLLKYLTHTQTLTLIRKLRHILKSGKNFRGLRPVVWFPFLSHTHPSPRPRTCAHTQKRNVKCVKSRFFLLLIFHDSEWLIDVLLLLYQVFFFFFFVNSHVFTAHKLRLYMGRSSLLACNSSDTFLSHCDIKHTNTHGPACTHVQTCKCLFICAIAATLRSMAAIFLLPESNFRRFVLLLFHGCTQHPSLAQSASSIQSRGGRQVACRPVILPFTYSPFGQ